MRWLARRGYAGIRPSDWLAWRRGEAALPDKPVLITFDDAYADVAEYALPVLDGYGFGAAVFVVTGQVGKTNTWDERQGSGTHPLMTAQQIRQWAGQGIEFGAHSRTHPDLRSLPAAELAEEIEGSKKDLTNLLGAPVLCFAYPYGESNAAVRQCAGAAFALAFGGDEKGLNHLATELDLLRRIMVWPQDSWLDLALCVRFGWHPRGKMRGLLLRAKWKLGGSRAVLAR